MCFVYRFHDNLVNATLAAIVVGIAKRRAACNLNYYLVSLTLKMLSYDSQLVMDLLDSIPSLNITLTATRIE